MNESLLTIEMSKMLFHAYHGLYESEKVNGAPFEVNIQLKYKKTALPLSSIEEAINYVDVFELVRTHMMQPEELLENLTARVGNDILNSFSLVEFVSVKISKLQPPIPSYTGSISVTFERYRD